MKCLRIALGIIILILSCALLIWGLLPARREIRSHPISPTELQLPTPGSLLVPAPSGLYPALVFVAPAL